MTMKVLYCFIAFLFITTSPVRADSGGILIPQQASYDVLFYKLDLRIDPGTKTIGGSTLVRALAVDTLSRFVLDLNANYAIDSIVWRPGADTVLTFSFTGGRIWIDLPYTLGPGDTAEVSVHYHGTPKVSTNPPWDDGFVWKTSASGAPWAGVACETEGGDAWWPCKDHPSDEPDSVSLNFTVPDTLVCVSNGRLIDTVDNLDGTKTFKWFVSNPINNYCVTFYLGQFERIPVSYTSITGEAVPSEYWFLPESKAAAISAIPLFLRDVRFYEETYGPFPFRADKYSICEAPYWGMEHQTVIAYGNHFNFNSYGFDYIHLHEVAHEWWGNLVTAKDWSDVWIHEGFACYTEALYAGYLNGQASYRSYMQGLRNFSNNQALAPRDTLTASQGFNGPVYNKGAWVLHTLRYYLGDTTFFRLLHRWAYPDSLMEGVTDGTQCRLATTDDFLAIAETVSGTTLDWFFEVYLRQVGIPRLSTAVVGDTLYLKWYIENDLPFPVPVEVRLGPDTVRVAMAGGTGRVAVPSGVTPVIDPDNWLLKTTIPVLSVSKTVVPFGAVKVDSAKSDSVVITNTWATTLGISSAASDHPDFTVSPSSADIPAGTSLAFTITFTPYTGGSRTGHVVFTHNAPGSPLQLTVGGSGIMPTSSYDVSGSWNLVSVPLSRTDPRRTVLFPGATSPAYSFGDSGYAATESLRTGPGYWLKFGADQTVLMAGLPVAAETIAVKSGWNLIGSLPEPLPVRSVASDPQGMSASGFFGYDGSYLLTDTIHPARGYWVKVDMNGELILSTGGAMNPAGAITIAPSSELPPPPPDEDGTGREDGPPAGYLLEQNYPNPFNPATVIRFSIPEPAFVSLRIFNVVGEEVGMPVYEHLAAGSHTAEWNTTELPSGIYFCRLSAGGFTETKKMVLMK
jgi:hypothetical protein